MTDVFTFVMINSEDMQINTRVTRSDDRSLPLLSRTVQTMVPKFSTKPYFFVFLSFYRRIRATREFIGCLESTEEAFDVGSRTQDTLLSHLITVLSAADPGIDSPCASIRIRCFLLVFSRALLRQTCARKRRMKAKRVTCRCRWSRWKRDNGTLGTPVEDEQRPSYATNWDTYVLQDDVTCPYPPLSPRRTDLLTSSSSHDPIFTTRTHVGGCIFLKGPRFHSNLNHITCANMTLSNIHRLAQSLFFRHLCPRTTRLTFITVSGWGLELKIFQQKQNFV